MLDKPSLLSRFGHIVGARHVVTEPADMERYLVEDRGLYHGRALCVVRPGKVEEVSRLVALCGETNTKIVPQGGNTGLVGGQIPSESGDEIVLSLARLTAIREVDAASNTMIVEAGVTLLRAQEEAEKADRLFPLSLASEGSCTIGGNLSTNAGGTAVLAYGNARDLVLGLEVVLADGRVLSNLSKLKKDNTGYDLKHLFMGAEGTLGIITAAVLKLFPRLRARTTAFVGLASPKDALSLLTLAQERAGSSLVTFELIPRIGIEFVLRHSPGARDPLSGRHAWYVLMELASQAEHGLEETAQSLLADAIERGMAEDAALASSLDQRNDFWRLREHLSEVQKHEGGSIKHDVSVPIAAVPAFIETAKTAVKAALPGARVVAFGHLGDGNIHFNVSQPIGADKAAFLARWHEINDVVHGIVATYGGSVSAEHGIGRLKRDLLPKVKDPVALDVMRALKRTLDPKGLLNPGKVL
jgi:FAD/FMN-containing dehydrogenase